MKKTKEKNKRRYRIDLVALAALFVFIITFCAYMMNTSFTDVLGKERGESVITHDYTFEESSVIEVN
ncbi:MAG: hypothetical protein IJU04_05880 [Ruminococcus sp.]|nr:hypothetical protein [Ruminococcus sp.]